MTKRKPLREDLLEAELGLALRSDGCPVCRLAGETERAVLSWLATTNIREEETITKLVDAGGLCAVHWAGVIERRGGDLGAAGARLLARIAEAASEDVGEGVIGGPPACPVCASAERRARSVLGMLFDLLAEPERLASYELSAGICRPHLTMAVGLNPDRSVLRVLVATQRRSLLALGERVHVIANNPTARTLAARRIIDLLAGSTSDG